MVTEYDAKSLISYVHSAETWVRYLAKTIFATVLWKDKETCALMCKKSSILVFICRSPKGLTEMQIDK